MSSDNSSTLKSAVDSVTGTVQEAYGKVFGSTEDQAKGDLKQDKASAENDASHAAIKGPGFTASSSGAIVGDNADRKEGQLKQTTGSIKEATGNVFGSESLKQSGHKENLEGQQQKDAGIITDFGKGVSDRVTGTVGGAVSALTGNKQAEKDYDNLHDEGKSRQRGVEHDVQKEGGAKTDL